MAQQSDSTPGATPPATSSPAATPSTSPQAPPTNPSSTTTPPSAGAATLPEVQVIQEQPKANPQPKPIQKAAKAPATVTAQSTPTSPTPPQEPTQIKMSPVGGSEIAIAKFPGSVSTITSADIARSETVSLENVLQTRVPGIIVSDLQGNDFQTDVQFRGFSASPVDGVPQGLAVYENGVRINEAFGDVVNWDFLPSVAVQNMAVLANNPAFGLNALGGAISITMKLTVLLPPARSQVPAAKL
jgi:iron complex outermembrane receptor protein